MLHRTSLSGQAAPNLAPRREFGFPATVQEPLFVFRSDNEIKSHTCYTAAKSGNTQAAIDLVGAFAVPLLNKLVGLVDGEQIPANHIVVAPHAREASGDNAIPQVLAALLSFAGGRLDENVVQTSKVYHTGADPMERLNARASFHGKIERGASYVLVDDVTTLGGTLCDLADFIQRGGGHPVAAAVLVNASRSGKLFPAQRTVALLEKRFGNEIREIFNIAPAALTADEAQYLIGFRTAEEIRGRSAQAREKTDLRLRSKGIRIDERGGQAQLTRPRRRVRLWNTARWVGKRMR